MREFSSKLPGSGTTIFTVMSQLATDYGAINLGQGFPDFLMSEELIELVNKAMKAGFNQYAHMNGLPLLREILAEKIHFLYGTKIYPETEITITPGGTYAIYTALTTVLHPGDEVIVFEPAYDSYIPNIEVNGAVAVPVALEFPSYSIPWEEVRKKVNGKTRLIILNSPHNPTGSVLSEHDMRELISIVTGTDILILSDEVYEHLVYDGISHQSMLCYPELKERSFVCFSFGKTCHCTGWKLGYCISTPILMKEFRKVHQFNCFSCDTPKQVALAGYLQNKKAYLEIGSFMQQKRDYFRTLLQNTGFEPLYSKGSYFECFTYGQLSNEPDKELAIRLTRDYGIAAIPVSAFYKTGTDARVLRFCFAKKEETLEKAADRLRKFAGRRGN